MKSIWYKTYVILNSILNHAHILTLNVTKAYDIVKQTLEHIQVIILGVMANLSPIHC